MQQANEAAIIAGKKLRTDTTAVETNIPPSNRRLLAICNALLRAARIVNHARAAKHRVLEIGPGGPDFYPGRPRAVKAKL